jgi:hypothetical protein
MCLKVIAWTPEDSIEHLNRKNGKVTGGADMVETRIVYYL